MFAMTVTVKMGRRNARMPSKGGVMISMRASRALISILLIAFMSACSVAPPVSTKKPSEGRARVRAEIEAAVASSDSELTKDTSTASGRRQATVQCDTVASMFVCTDGQAICWWNRRTGYGCN
jgi:hypothetical protein